MGGAQSRAPSLDNSQITDEECEDARGEPLREDARRTEGGGPEWSAGLLAARNQAFPRIQSSQTCPRSTLRCYWVAAPRSAPDLRLRQGPARRCAPCGR